MRRRTVCDESLDLGASPLFLALAAVVGFGAGILVTLVALLAVIP